MKRQLCLIAGVAVVVNIALTQLHAAGQPADLTQQTTDAMKRATAYMTSTVSAYGGYLSRYDMELFNADGTLRSAPTVVSVHPPGTPSVGSVLIRVYRRTGDSLYLNAARPSAYILHWGQMTTGGWRDKFDLDPESRQWWSYRHNNNWLPLARRDTSFDDDISQGALRFLMEFDQATGFTETTVREAVNYALTHFLEAQYPNGAWPQRYDAPYHPINQPVIPASYPEFTPARMPDINPILCPKYYTINDNVIYDMIRTLLLAYEIYGDFDYFKAARKAGDFLLLAQMPDPQPAWAQQYDFNMHPAWGRWFEPPAIASNETAFCIYALMNIYAATGEAKYKDAIPPALEWLEASVAASNYHTRFYELERNRRIYVNNNGDIVFGRVNLYPGYTWRSYLNTPRIRDRYEQIEDYRARYLSEGTIFDRTDYPVGDDTIEAILNAQDAKGRWITNNTLDLATFINNMDLLSRYVATHE